MKLSIPLFLCWKEAPFDILCDDGAVVVVQDGRVVTRIPVDTSEVLSYCFTLIGPYASVKGRATRKSITLWREFHGTRVKTVGEATLEKIKMKYGQLRKVRSTLFVETGIWRVGIRIKENSVAKFRFFCPTGDGRVEEGVRWVFTPKKKTVIKRLYLDPQIASLAYFERDLVVCIRGTGSNAEVTIAKLEHPFPDRSTPVAGILTRPVYIALRRQTKGYTALIRTLSVYGRIRDTALWKLPAASRQRIPVFVAWKLHTYLVPPPFRSIAEMVREGDAEGLATIASRVASAVRAMEQEESIPHPLRPPWAVMYVPSVGKRVAIPYILRMQRILEKHDVKAFIVIKSGGIQYKIRAEWCKPSCMRPGLYVLDKWASSQYLSKRPDLAKVARFLSAPLREKIEMISLEVALLGFNLSPLEVLARMVSGGPPLLYALATGALTPYKRSAALSFLAHVMQGKVPPASVTLAVEKCIKKYALERGIVVLRTPALYYPFTSPGDVEDVLDAISSREKLPPPGVMKRIIKGFF